MAGREAARRHLPFEVPAGTVKTYALEVNLPHEDVDGAASRIQDFAGEAGFTSRRSNDPAIVFAWAEGISLVIDVLDPRFWLVHTTSRAGPVQRLLRTHVWHSTDIDWCWLPSDSVRRMQDDGETRWFKSDFRGDDLLRTQPVEARRLKVQLEGDHAQRLFNLLSTNEAYRSSSPLTAIALRLGSTELGYVDEAAHYRGRFVARGTSFEVHVGFVSKWIRQYAEDVRSIERRHTIGWETEQSGAYRSHGETVMIKLGRPISDIDLFASSLFSSRDPFRLWAVPRSTGGDAIEAEVVDLHLGQQLRMDITRDWIRVYLPKDACGNTVFRLVSNLQHRYDATVNVPRTPTGKPSIPVDAD